jgi:hypothetical protein
MKYLQRKPKPLPPGGWKDPRLTRGGEIFGGGVPPVAQSPDAGQYPDPWQDPYGYSQSPVSGLQQGGIVTEPTTALIGENGPEMVVPLGYRPDAKVGPRNALPQMSYAR